MICERSPYDTFAELQRKYAESHEWVDIAADGKTCKSSSYPIFFNSTLSFSNSPGTVGISAYAAGALGDVVYVELPAVGDDVTVGEAFGTVESVKSASDVNSPISGSVVEVNQPIADTPSDLGLDPEGEGWLIKIEAEDVSALEGLMDEAAYTEHTKDK